MSLYTNLASKVPDLKERLKTAGIAKKPEPFIKECVSNALLLSFLISVIFSFVILKAQKSILIVFVLFIIAVFFFYFLFLKRVDVMISKRSKEIDKDVLFAGRFLLVKLNSGKPLINSIIDASQSYGVASKYFKEMVEDIELGTPMEQALENAYKTSPSKRFAKILFQISNALKIGIDVSAPLEAILEEIGQEQLIEIQRYGKKLSSITMFYMLLAIIVPSLGITLFSVVASMVNLKVDMQALVVILFFLALIQFIFISVFKSIRPNLNL